jgi:hypothetical protein
MLRSVLSRLAMTVVFMCLSGSLRAAVADAFAAPSGGEIYIVGQTQRIHITRGVLKKNVLVELSRDGGVTFETVGTIAAPNKANPREFILDFSISGAATSNAILRASGAAHKGPLSVLSSPFAIAAANVTAGGTIPAGGVLTADLADGSVTTPKLADGSVTAIKQNSGAASPGFVLTADGSGGAAYLQPATSGNALILPFLRSTASAATLFDLTNTSDASAGSFAIGNSSAVSAALQGKTSGLGAGVSGFSALGDGVLGQSSSAAGIHGKKSGTDVGSAGVFENLNAANTSDTLSTSSNSTGLALHATGSGAGSAATFEATGTTNTLPAVNARHFGLGDALSVTAPNAASSGNGITVNTSGTGNGINSTSDGGTGITGATNALSTTNFIAGVEGDNNSDGPGVLGVANTGFGAVLGINSAPGAGVEGYSLADGGFGIYGLGGQNSFLTVAGHFENRFATNTANTLEVATNAPSTAVEVKSTSNSAGSGITVTMAAGKGGTALKVANGAVAFHATTGYTNSAVVDNAYLIVTAAGALTLATAAPLSDGATVWVVNNSGGTVSVTNANNGPINIANGNAKQFVFIKTVSATNWIPVQ